MMRPTIIYEGTGDYEVALVKWERFSIGDYLILKGAYGRKQNRVGEMPLSAQRRLVEWKLIHFRRWGSPSYGNEGYYLTFLGQLAVMFNRHMWELEE